MKQTEIKKLKKTSYSTNSDVACKLNYYASFFKEENFSHSKGRFLCGDVLLQAKKLLPRGDFTKWLLDEFPLDPRLAQNWMNMSRYLNRKEVIDLDIPAGSLYILARPSTPQAARQFIYDLYRRGDVASRSEVISIVRYFSGQLKSLPPRFCNNNEAAEFDHVMILDEIEDGEIEVERSQDQLQLESVTVNSAEQDELQQSSPVEDKTDFLDLSTFSSDYDSESEVSDYKDSDQDLPFEKTTCMLLKPKGAPYILSRSIRYSNNRKTGGQQWRGNSFLESLPLDCWEFYGKNFPHLVVNAPFRYFTLRQRCSLLVKYAHTSVYWLSYISDQEQLSLSRAYSYLASDLNFFTSLRHNILGVSTFTFNPDNFTSSYEEETLVDSCSTRLSSFSDFQFTLLIHQIPNVNFLVDLESLDLPMSIVVFDQNVNRVHSALRAWQSAFGRESIRHFYPGLLLSPSDSSSLPRQRQRKRSNSRLDR